jgi:hypothetical protein
MMITFYTTLVRCQHGILLSAETQAVPCQNVAEVGCTNHHCRWGYSNLVGNSWSLLPSPMYLAGTTVGPWQSHTKWYSTDHMMLRY